MRGNHRQGIPRAELYEVNPATKHASHAASYVWLSIKDVTQPTHFATGNYAMWAL